MEQLNLTDTGHPIKMLVNFMELQETPFDDGLTMVKLRIKEHQAINVFILSLQMIINKSHKLSHLRWKLNKTLFIVEFLLTNKKMILIDNVSLCLIDIQIISLLKTLGQDLITNEKDFLKLWNCLIETESTKSLFPAKTDFVDLDLNYLSGNSYKTIQKSWFSIKVLKPVNKYSLKTFLPFYKFLLAGGMVKEAIQTEILRIRKIKLKLNSIQKKTLQMWADHHRYSYNKAINIINGDKSEMVIYNGTNPESANTFYGRLELRDQITPAATCSRIPWILKTPKHIRESGVFEAHKNFKSALSNLKNGHIKYFNLRFKSKKHKSWSFEVPKESIKTYDKQIGLYEKETTNARIKTTEKIPIIEHNCNVIYDGLNHYICIPVKVERKENTTNGMYASLDPGVRKFQTVYSPDQSEFLMIGNGSAKEMYKHLLKLDKLLSKKNCKNRLKAEKLRMKISNLQDELHYKTTKYLCNNYKCIYIPKLTNENDIIKVRNRKINTKTVRNMVVLGHCKFVERLKTKAEEFTNVKVHVISEEFTSQRCLNCRELTKMKKGEEIHKCNFCKMEIDRDVLGSTNILLKNW